MSDFNFIVQFTLLFFAILCSVVISNFSYIEISIKNINVENEKKKQIKNSAENTSNRLAV